MTTEDLIIETGKELAMKAYEDTAQPALKSTGELFELIPRAIRAMVSSLEIWTIKREFQVKAVTKLLEEKLKNLPPEQIVTPEAYIAVPALQSISYCMNNDELRDMYANLLASSMNKVMKDGVHPSYVEIIRQLCPDEAKILRYIALEEEIPTISIHYGDTSAYSVVVKDFSDVGFVTQCEQPNDIRKYLGNLVRLGLINIPDSSLSMSSSLTDKQLYEELRKNSCLQSLLDNANIPKAEKDKIKFIEGYASITDYGRGFCSICLNTTSSPE